MAFVAWTVLKVPTSTRTATTPEFVPGVPGEAIPPTTTISAS